MRVLRVIFALVYITLVVTVAIELTKIVTNVTVKAYGSIEPRLNGNKIVVAVVDTGLDLDDVRFKGLICEGSKDFTGTGMKDNHGHGTHVAGIIKRYAGKANYCLLILKYYDAKQSDKKREKNTIEAFKYAASMRVNIVNYSSGGKGRNDEEKEVIAANPWLLFIVAAGNEARDISEPGKEVYPASYQLSNIIAVGCLQFNGNICEASDFGYPIAHYELGEMASTLPSGDYGFMSGTSMAAAVFTGKIVSGKALTHSNLTRKMRERSR